MKMKKVLALLLALLLVGSLFTVSLTVSAAAPQAINSVDDFMAMEAKGSYYLEKDLIIEQEWGDAATTFDGTFDGRGHKIIINNCPVFYYLGGTAVVKNLTIEGKNEGIDGYSAALAFHTSGGSWYSIRLQNITNNAIISCATEWGYAGALIGDAFAPNLDCSITMINCVNNGAVTASKVGAAGGLIGNWRGGELTATNCVNTGDVIARQDAGGLIGRVASGGTVTIQNCLNTGKITNTGNMLAGGAIGWLKGTATISNFTNEGNITSSTDAEVIGAGGFIGGAHNREPAKDHIFIATITKSLNTGKVSGGGATGAFVGCGNGSSATCELNISECINKNADTTNLVGSAAKSGTVDTSKTEAQIESLGYQEPPKPGEKPALSGGTGTEADPYLISNKADLIAFSNAVGIGDDYINTYVKLTADIDLEADATFTPIGSEYSTFNGVFDGNGFTVSGLHLDYKGGEAVGLFGGISGATIKNLTVKGDLLRSGYVVGAIAACVYEGAKIVNCTSEIDKIEAVVAGGIIGSSQGGDGNLNYVVNCVSNSNVGAISGSNDYSIGGIAGSMGYTFVFGCENNGDVISKVIAANTAGGLAGTMRLGAYLVGSVNNGTVKIYTENEGVACYAAGLAAKANGMIWNCVNNGAVSIVIEIGSVEIAQEGAAIAGVTALITKDSYAYIDNCYNTADVVDFTENLFEDDSAFLLNAEAGCKKTLEDINVTESALIDVLNRMSALEKYSDQKLAKFDEKCNGDFYGYTCTAVCEKLKVSGTGVLVSIKDNVVAVEDSVAATVPATVTNMIQAILAVQEEVNDMPAPKKEENTDKTEETTETPKTENTQASAQTEKKGCKGTISLGSMVVLAIIPLAAVCTKKKDYEI